MHSEINAVVNFLSRFLYNKLPRRKVTLFAQQLSNELMVRCTGTWNPSNPKEGSDLRRISVRMRGTMDTVLSLTALNVGLNVEEIFFQFPDELCVWIDPGQVSYQIGERGLISFIYNRSDANGVGNCGSVSINQVLPHTASFNFDNNNSAANLMRPNPINYTSSTFGSQLPAPIVQQENNNPSTFIEEMSPTNDVHFTVASFAATRFGTTKIKNMSHSLNRIRQKQRASRMFNEIRDASYNSCQTENRSSLSDPSADEDSLCISDANNFISGRPSRDIQPIAPPFPVRKIEKSSSTSSFIDQSLREAWPMRTMSSKPAPPPAPYADEYFDVTSEGRSPPSTFEDRLPPSLTSVTGSTLYESPLRNLTKFDWNDFTKFTWDANNNATSSLIQSLFDRPNFLPSI